jgi:hypothetical protein
MIHERAGRLHRKPSVGPPVSHAARSAVVDGALNADLDRVVALASSGDDRG